jgi:hypothetical protein
MTFKKTKRGRDIRTLKTGTELEVAKPIVPSPVAEAKPPVFIRTFDPQFGFDFPWTPPERPSCQ